MQTPTSAPISGRAAGANHPSSLPALVCLHGLSGSSRWWSPVVPHLERTGRVVPLDVPRRVRPHELASWLAARLEELDPPVDLAGHSLGAIVSVRVAAARPDLVRRLVLVSPPGIRPRRTPAAYAWPLARTVARSRPAFLARLGRDALRAGPVNLVRGGLHVASADVTPELVAVASPTLLVWGARDRLVSVEEAPAWCERLPAARLVVLPHARHVPMVEAPAELAEAIASFREERLDETRDERGS